MSKQQPSQHHPVFTLSTLIANAIHELNNPVSGILGLAQVLTLDDGLQPQTKEAIEDIEKAALRCKQILAALQRYLRASTSRDIEMFYFQDFSDSFHDHVKKNKELQEYTVQNTGTTRVAIKGIQDVVRYIFIRMLEFEKECGRVGVYELRLSKENTATCELLRLNVSAVTQEETQIQQHRFDAMRRDLEALLMSHQTWIGIEWPNPSENILCVKIIFREHNEEMTTDA
jgi:signal transduction histidine kinase